MKFFKTCLILGGLLLSACLRQIPVAAGIDRLIVQYQQPEQRQAVQSFFVRHGYALSSVSQAGGRAEYQLTVPEAELERLLQALPELGPAYRFERREQALVLVCCQ